MCIDFQDVGDSPEKPHMAVNIRTIKGVDLKKLNVKQFDGRHLF